MTYHQNLDEVPCYIFLLSFGKLLQRLTHHCPHWNMEKIWLKKNILTNAFSTNSHCQFLSLLVDRKSKNLLHHLFSQFKFHQLSSLFGQEGWYIICHINFVYTKGAKKLEKKLLHNLFSFNFHLAWLKAKKVVTTIII